MKFKTSFAILALLALGLGLPAQAQTTVGSTTLSAALSATADSAVVASVTGITASRGGQGLTYLFIDKELLIVEAVNSTTLTVTIRRGQLGTKATSHVTSSVVWRGPPAYFANQAPPVGSQCVRTSLIAVPVIVPSTGETFDCLGVTTAGRYVRTNAPSDPVVGSTVASATSITPTGTFFVVSGTTEITTIVVPAGWKPGMCLDVNPSGTFTTATGGNIAIASTAVVNKIQRVCWNGTAWIPSYLS